MHETRGLTMDVDVLGFWFGQGLRFGAGLCFRRSRLAARELLCSRGQAGQCGAVFQEAPPVRSIGIHDYLLRFEPCLGPIVFADRFIVFSKIVNLSTGSCVHDATRKDSKWL